MKSAVTAVPSAPPPVLQVTVVVISLLVVGVLIHAKLAPDANATERFVGAWGAGNV
jgi:hypothetical protein